VLNTVRRKRKKIPQKHILNKPFISIFIVNTSKCYLSELFHGDFTIPITVKEGKGLFQAV
jgi:hypothetical protein